MTLLSPVVWSEGMHLAQHHFQAQSRFFEDVTATAAAFLNAHPYGFVSLDVDADAVRNGVVALHHARGIMPDGLLFHFPEDPLPRPLDIRDGFSATQNHLTVVLAIPRLRPRQPNCAPSNEPDHGATRYVAAREPLTDETTGSDQKPVDFARKNFRLIPAGEAGEAVVTLPIARIRRGAGGGFEYDPHHVPPCLQLGASPRLLELLTRLVDILHVKVEATERERRASNLPISEYAAREIGNFWFSHVVRSAAATLKHHAALKSSSPERVFLELSRLAGALCTFSMEADVGSIPTYDHDQPEACWTALDGMIRQLLDVMVPSRTVRIPLQADGRGFYNARIADPRCFHNATWFLGVRSTVPRTELIAGVPDRITLCSTTYLVGRLVQDSLSGMRLEHEAAPPAALSPRLDTQYFRIDKTRPCWDTVVDASEVSAFAAAALNQPELEVLVVLEG